MLYSNILQIIIQIEIGGTDEKKSQSVHAPQLSIKIFYFWSLTASCISRILLSVRCLRIPVQGFLGFHH